MTPAVQPTSPRAGARRVRYGLTTTILLVAVTVAVVLATALADARRVRFDATATREHTLSSRTAALLKGLTRPHEIVVVADFSNVDPRARDRIGDVLEEYARSSSLITYSRIDTSSVADRAAYSGLLDRLAELHRERLQMHLDAAQAATAGAAGLAQAMPVLADRLTALAGALPPSDARSRVFSEAGGAARNWAADLAHVTAASQAALAERVAGSTIPAVDRAVQALLAPLRRLMDELEPLRVYLEDQLPTLSGPAADAARSAATAASTLRDQAASDADRLMRLPSLELMGIIRAIEMGPAAIVVSPTGATAVNFEALFPSRKQIEISGGRQADLRFSGEELIATAIGALSSDAAPIVAFIHAGAQRLLDASGRPDSNEARTLMERLTEQLALRRIDAREWAVTLDRERPTFEGSTLGGGRRPVVWVVIPILGSSQDSMARIGQLADALKSLIDAGENVLLSLEPSTLPSVGEADPMARLAEPFGVIVDSGRPLLRRISSPRGWTVLPGQEIIGGGGDHPVAAALRDQRTLLPWPLPITLLPPSSDGPAEDERESWPLLAVAAGSDTWGESQWLEFRALPPAQRSMVSNPPQPEEKWDNLAGPWIVAAAAQRRAPSGGAPQRMIVVGANGWHFDQFTQQTRVVDGVTGLSFPGNGDLFESAIYWLAHQDELVAPSSRTRRIPTIPALAPPTLAALRWSLVAGLPALVLGIGLALRLLRG